MKSKTFLPIFAMIVVVGLAMPIRGAAQETKAKLAELEKKCRLNL